MNETKRWVLSGHDPLNQAGLLRQIDEAEEKKRAHYYLSFQDRGGGFLRDRVRSREGIGYREAGEGGV